MKPYPLYKDSGVEWIGEIPSHWDESKIKYESVVPVQYGINTSSDSYVEEGIRFIRTTDITDNGCLTNEGVYLEEDLIEDIFKTKMNDLLISRSGTLGRTYLQKNEKEFTYGGYLVRFNFGDKTKSRFVFYYTKSMNFQDWLSLNTIQSTIGNVNGQKYSNLYISIPPNSEQKQIVSFLDHKTQKIDELIEKTEKKIELLKEKRTSLINHCVTKGLNPDVELKDSGVEWIGEIPSGWEVSKFNFYVQLRHGYQFRDYDFTDEGIRIIKITQLHKNGYLDISNCSFIDYSRLGDFTDIVVRENDILMCLTGGTIGKIIRVGKVNEPLLQNYRVGHFSPKKRDKITDDYLFWLMSSDVINGQIFYEIRETGQPNIGMDDFGRMKICLPPISEQTQIVGYIDEQTQKIDSTIEKESQRIGLLKEYRQSLISEVVTGKIDVREEVVA